MYITNAADLKSAIKELEHKKVIQEKMLVAHFSLTYESLKPLNIIKHTFTQIAHSNDLKTNILNTSLGMGAGIITKKLMVGRSKSIFRRLMGAAIEFGIASLVAKNPDKVKMASQGLMSLFSKKTSKFNSN